MDYKQTLDFLYGSMPSFQIVGSSAYKPGLDNIIGFCRYLGDPQNDFLTVHVAGTNGKGSVSHMIAAVLMAAGYRTGLYTSPHLHDFRERIRIDGQTIEERDVTGFVSRHGKRMREAGLSFFEMTTALAFDSFSRCGVQIAVIETGLGGRLDATNIITPLLSVITNIGLEHTQYLGDTIAKIAAEKAGIIKDGVPVVIGESDPESDPVFLHAAESHHSPIVFADRRYEVAERISKPFCESYTLRPAAGGAPRTVEIDLAGDCQRKNIVTVMAALDALKKYAGLSLPDKKIREGLRDAAFTTSLAGRWQIIGTEPLTVCDTGHNEHGLRTVVGQIKRQTYRKLYMVIGVVSDKDLSRIIPLMPRHAVYIFTQAGTPRALPAEELRKAFAEAGIDGTVITPVRRAVEYARERAEAEDMIFIGGSTYTVAEII